MLRILKLRTKKTVVSLLFATTLLLTAFQSVAFANYFIAGTVYSTSSNVKGAYTEINTSTYAPMESPYFNCEWSMIAQDSGVSGNFAQVGWAIQPYVASYPQYFFGWSVDGTYYEQRSTVGPAENTWHSYQVSLEADGKIHGWADDTEIWNIDTHFTPTGVEYANEHSNPSSVYYQGTTTNKSTFRNVKYYNGNLNQWVRPSLSFMQDLYGGLDTTNYSNSGYFDTWDTRR